jgi:hypothetical protein
VTAKFSKLPTIEIPEGTVLDGEIDALWGFFRILSMFLVKIQEDNLRYSFMKFPLVLTWGATEFRNLETKSSSWLENEECFISISIK